MRLFFCIAGLLLLFVDSSFSIGQAPLGGIPVPGRTVPVLRLFENYGAQCRPNGKKDFRMDQLAQILRSFNAEEVAQKVYSQLFFAMGDIQIDKLMGKWYRVVDSQNIHQDDCAIFYFNMLSHTDFTATFTATQYALKNGEVVSYEGYGTMNGPDPGETFLSTGHTEDNCPYFPVKLGGLNHRGEYEYIILSQPLKYPTMVLTRDLDQFDLKYRSEVYNFVEKHGFLSPIAALNTRLHFVNTTMCAAENKLYDRY